MTTGDLQNRIVTEFLVSGDKKVEQALAQITEKQRQFAERAAKNAQRTAAEADKIGRAFNALNRQNALDKIERGFIEAAKSGKNLEQVMESLRRKIELVGASQEEVNRIVRAGARAVQEQEGGGRGGGRGGNALQRLGSEVRALPAVPLGGGLSSDVIGKVINTLGGLGPAGAAAAIGIGAAIVALKSSTSQIEQTVKAIIASQEAYYRALSTGTKESINEQIKATEIELQIVSARVQEYQTLFQNLEAQVGGVGRALSDILDLGGSQQLRVETQALEEKQRELEFTLGRLRQAVGDTAVETRTLEEQERKLAEARQAQTDRRLQTTLQTQLAVAEMDAEAISKRTEAINREIQAITELIKSGEGSAELNDQLRQRFQDLGAELLVLNSALPEAQKIQRLAEAEAYLKKQREELAAATEKYNDQVAAIEQRALEERASLQQKFNDRLVDIAQKAADSAEDAVRKLSQRRADLATNLGRDLAQADREAQLERLDAQLEFQREESRSAREHADALVEIRRQGQVAEQDAISNRDAVALFRARENTTEQIREEQQQYQQERRERQIAYRDQLQDLGTAAQREREQRFLKYQQDLVDAQLQFDREREQRNIDQQRQLRDLEASTARELALSQQKNALQLQTVRTAYEQELRIVSQGQSARLQLEAQYQQRLLEQARRVLAGLNGTTYMQSRPGSAQLRTLASGGSLSAFESAIVNERRTESFTSSGRTIQLPDGMGIFTPARAGRVNPQGGGSGVNISINASGMSPRQVGRAVERRLEEFVRAYEGV